ncbi:MAG: SusC/RagA family protein, partial [Chitinophagaceae bacterium]|nr:SusC/RagA family protein [Chitinophagaceae bacterium]
LQGVYGNKLFNYNRYNTDFFTGTNYGSNMLNAWTSQNTKATIPELNLNTSAFESQASSYYIEDGSYFRGKNIQLGYTLPTKMLSNLSIDRLRVYAQVLNFFTVTKYSGVDPEVNLSFYGNGADRDIGVDRGVYPTSRSFIVGVQLGF